MRFPWLFKIMPFLVPMHDLRFGIHVAARESSRIEKDLATPAAIEENAFDCSCRFQYAGVFVPPQVDEIQELGRPFRLNPWKICAGDSAGCPGLTGERWLYFLPPPLGRRELTLR
jgi:hypothetical protein